jgi:hypothetical protein
VPRTIEQQSRFQKDLKALLNRYSMENESDTPDYILATYLAQCLEAFEFAVRTREVWYGRPKPRRKDKWNLAPPTEIGDPYKVPDSPSQRKESST